MDSLSSTLRASRLSDNTTTHAPHSDSIPVTLTRSYVINSVETDMFCQLFSDRIVFVVSQLSGKVGTYLLCNMDESIIDNKMRFQVTPLLGKRNDTVLEVLCRQVHERIALLRTTAGSTCPPVLLGVSLKQTDPEMFRTIVDLLVKLYKEAIQVAASSSS